MNIDKRNDYLLIFFTNNVALELKLKQRYAMLFFYVTARAGDLTIIKAG